MTSESSQAPNSNPLTSSAVDSRARISARPESGLDLKALAAAFGLSSPVLLANFDHDSLSLRTSQGCLLSEEQWGESLETLPDSGMWDAGRVYELATSGRVTSGSGSSSWPTAVTRDTGRTGETVESGKASRSREKIASLSIEAQCWPTARSEDSESCGNHPGAMDSLTGVVKQWPTPQAHDQRGAKTPDQIEAQRTLTGAGVRNLNEEVSTWSTPGASPQQNRTTHYTPSHLAGTHGRNLAADVGSWQTPATDSFRSRGGDRKDEPGLDQQARMFDRNNWPSPMASDAVAIVDQHGAGNLRLLGAARLFPTPAARDYRSEKGGEKTLAHFNRSAGPSFPAFVEHSPQAPQIPDGPQSSESAPTSRRRLNPRFVEWLMGFPIGHTEL